LLRFFSGIRLRLLLLVALPLLPMLGVMLLSYQEQKQQAIIEGQNSALRLARLAAKDQDSLLEEARQLMLVMAQLPVVRTHDAQKCNEFLASLLKQFPIYENLGAVDPNGALFCSAVPFAQLVSFSDRDWFHLAIDTRNFVAGDYIIARITGRPTLTNAYPVFTETNQLSAVVFAGIDLGWLDSFVAEAQLPQGSTLTVADQTGTILTRYPGGEQWRGKSLPPSTVQLLTANIEGVSDKVGMDGVPRLYGFTRLCCLPSKDIYVQVGIPRESALAQANRMLARNLIILGLVAFLGLAVAKYGADLFVLHPLSALLKAIKSFDSGDFSFRVGKTAGGKELDQVGHALNQMAAAVETRQDERNRMEEILRVQNSRAQALATTASHLNTHHDLKHMLDIVCQEITRALLMPAVSISLYDDTRDTLYFISRSGPSQDFCERIEAFGLDGFIPRLKHGEAIFTPHNQAHAAIDTIPLDGLGVRAFTCNPLMHEGRLVGALCVFIQDEEHSFNDGELTFLVSISDQAAQAIVNARLYQTLKEEQLSRTALLEKTISAQEDERKRIARELHDQTSQDLAALMLNLDAFALGLHAKGPGTEQHLLTAKTMVNTILTNIHHLINDLRPSLLDDLGLASAILWYGEQRLKSIGIAFEFQCNRTEARLPPPVEIALFRIAQEALTNIVRHANATRVKVTLDLEEHTVSMVIEDNGVGFQITTVMSEQLDGRGLGLRGMQERVTTLGGEMDIQSTPGQGTIIKAKVAWFQDGFADA
jgi:signal transduction histidine kinase